MNGHKKNKTLSPSNHWLVNIQRTHFLEFCLVEGQSRPHTVTLGKPFQDSGHSRSHRSAAEPLCLRDPTPPLPCCPFWFETIPGREVCGGGGDSHSVLKDGEGSRTKARRCRGSLSGEATALQCLLGNEANVPITQKFQS